MTTVVTVAMTLAGVAILVAGVVGFFRIPHCIAGGENPAWVRQSLVMMLVSSVGSGLALAAFLLT